MSLTIGLALTIGAQAGTTNIVTNVGFSAYRINGLSNPTLSLFRGVTYTFEINAPGHPFWIKTARSTGTGNAFTKGVTGNGTTDGTLTFAVPADAPDRLFYICQLHSAMNGQINISNPPTPPDGRIVSLSVGNIVEMKSVGATGFQMVPEFNADPGTANWLPVPSFTNNFANGTNTTAFDRLDPICGPNVFLRVKNTFTP